MKKSTSFKNVWSVLVMEMKFSKSTFVLLVLVGIVGLELTSAR